MTICNSEDWKYLLVDHHVEYLQTKNNEALKDLRAIKHKLNKLKHMWKTHLHKSSSTSADNQPKQVKNAPQKMLTSLLDGSSSDVNKLEEELISCRLTEVDLATKLQECKSKLKDVEFKSSLDHKHITRQTELILKLQVLQSSKHKMRPRTFYCIDLLFLNQSFSSIQ